jgi:hypothetical protein
MKNWFQLALVLAVLASGVWLVWSEDDPSIDQANTGRGENSVQVESRDSTLSNDPGTRIKTGQLSARDPDSRFRQASDTSSADDLVSIARERPSRSTAFTANSSSAPDVSDHEKNEELVIGGMVIDEDGSPLSGIEVLARRIDPEDGPSPSFDQMDEGVLSIFSDFGGAFLFSDLEDGTYQLRIAPAEGVAPDLTTVRVGPLNVKLVVVLLWDIRVYGTVSSTAGKSLENVQVTAGRQTLATRTGSQGEYKLNISMQGVKRKQFVHFRRDGYRDQKLAINPDELDYRSTKLQFNVTMDPIANLTSVAGSLSDTEGRSVPGQILTMASSKLRTSYQAQSDKKGIFMFKEVEPGKDYRLQIRPGSDYLDKDINSLDVPDSGLNLNIVLDLIEQGELSGWMIDLNANPIPGFALNLHSRVVAGKSVRVQGNQQGFFLVQDFPVGDAVFSTNSYPVFSVQGILVSPEPEEPIMVILDIGTHVLEGRVLDSLGGPVAGASVIMTWTFSESGVQSSSSRKTAADPDGSFVFTGLGPGLHRMQVSASGFRATVVKIDVGISRDNIVVELEEES